VKLPILLKVFLFVPCVTHGAVFSSQVETFDAPTDWRIGRQNFGIPSINANFGPEGAGDFALLTSSSAGGGPTSRLIIFNEGDWAGNYSGSGVTGLSMDLRNTGQGDLFIRIAVNGPGGWFVTDGQAVDAGLGYANFLFDLRPVAFNPARSNDPTLGTDIDATLADTTQIRILHSLADGDVRGEVGNATLRIDNITAVPEPAIPLILSLSLILFVKRKR
jgi:hypothetical protein